MTEVREESVNPPIPAPGWLRILKIASEEIKPGEHHQMPFPGGAKLGFVSAAQEVVTGFVDAIGDYDEDWYERHEGDHTDPLDVPYVVGSKVYMPGQAASFEPVDGYVYVQWNAVICWDPPVK